MNFFEEVDQTYRTSSLKKTTSRLTFKTGLLTGALSVLVMMMIVGFQNFGKEESFETTSLKLDSIQISQNNRMIQLLEKHAQRDTTIVHIVAPAF